MQHGGVLKQPASFRPAVFDALLGDGAPGDGAPGAAPVLRASAPVGTVRSGANASPGTSAPGPERPARPAVVAGTSVRVAPAAVRIDPPAAPLRAQPPATTAPPPSPEALCARQEAEAQARREAELTTARDEAYEAGRAAGRAAAENALRAEVEALRASAATDIARLEALWQAHHDRVERQLVALAVEVAAMLTEGPLPEATREAADRALAQAVESLARGDGLSVRLHPVDYLRLQELGLVDGLSAAHPALRWTPDEALAEGDWVVDSAEAVVRHVRTELLEGLRARLDLLQAIQDVPRAASQTPARTAPARAPEAPEAAPPPPPTPL